MNFHLYIIKLNIKIKLYCCHSKLCNTLSFLLFILCYIMTGLSLTENQIKKIINAANKQTSVTIRLTENNLQGSHKLPLSKTQINRVNKARNANHGLNLTMSYAQIKHIKKWIEELQKRGGFIPLLTLIPIIASALGAVGGVSGGVASAISASNNAKAARAAQAETERHNREIEKQLKEGSGVVSDYIEKVPVIGHYLKPILQKLGLDCATVLKGGCIKCGEGLYLRPYGEGLYIGPPS
jgi:hypothetical protein